MLCGKMLSTRWALCKAGTGSVIDRYDKTFEFLSFPVACLNVKCFLIRLVEILPSCEEMKLRGMFERNKIHPIEFLFTPNINIFTFSCPLYNF